MKKFTIPCNFGNINAPFDVYIGSPKSDRHPLHFQNSWLSRERGGLIPDDVMTSFKKLYELSYKNNVSFEDLCVYALEEANKEKTQGKTKESKSVSNVKKASLPPSETALPLPESPKAPTPLDLGRFYLRKQNYKAAIEQFKKIERGPDYVACRMGLAEVYYRQKQYREGAAIFQQVEMQADTLGCTWLSGLLYHAGYYDKAYKYAAMAALPQSGYSSEDQYVMGLLNAQGHGLPQNREKALYWWEQSARQGYEPAMDALVSVYEQGTEYEQEKADCWRKNARARTVKFKIFTILESNWTKQTAEIYLLEHHLKGEHPLIYEEERLLRDYGVRIADDVKDSFKRLFEIAQEHKIEFVQLCEYALNKADSKEEEETTGNE